MDNNIVPNQPNQHTNLNQLEQLNQQAALNQQAQLTHQEFITQSKQVNPNTGNKLEFVSQHSNISDVNVSQIETETQKTADNTPNLIKTPKKGKNKGLIFAIATLAVVMLIGAIALLASPEDFFKEIFSNGELGSSDAGGKNTVEDALQYLYGSLDYTNSDNYVAGHWYCSAANSSEYITRINLEKDGTYMHGDYNDLANNHFAGTYSFEDLKKENASGDYRYFSVVLDTMTEYVDKGVIKEITETQPIKIEMGVSSSNLQKQAVVYFYGSSGNIYYCYDEDTADRVKSE